MKKVLMQPADSKKKSLKNGQVQSASDSIFLPTMLLYFMRQRRKIRGHTTTQSIQQEAVWVHESLNALRKAYF
jgi:hypothetical protein